MSRNNLNKGESNKLKSHIGKYFDLIKRLPYLNVQIEKSLISMTCLGIIAETYQCSIIISFILVILSQNY